MHNKVSSEYAEKVVAGGREAWATLTARVPPLICELPLGIFEAFPIWLVSRLAVTAHDFLRQRRESMR
jgi:hypothetical protein